MIKHEQELAYKILELVRTNKVARTPLLEDLAEQYAKLCGDINGRLSKCSDYLARGMRSEAIHEAQTQPALLELVRTVQFQEIAKWRSLCQEQQLAVPPQLMNDVVERLRKELPKEQELDPLLRQYRRLVHQGRAFECIQVLRQIIELDAENPVWKENLASLEDDHYEEFIARIEEALRQNDLAAIQECYDEAIHPSRLLPLPADVTQRLVAALQARQREALMVRAQELCATLAGHMESGDAPLVEADLRQWESLASNEVFQPNAAQLEVVVRAQIMLEGTEKAKELLLHQQELFGALRGVLELASPSESLVRQRLQEIKAAGIELPDDLATEANRILATIAERRLHRRNLALGAGGVVLLLGLAAGGAWLFLQEQKSQDQAALEQFRKQVEGGELFPADVFAKRLLQERPKLVLSPEFQALSGKLEEMKKSREAKNEQFSKAMTALMAISARNYEELDETINRHLGDAQNAAVDGAQRQDLLRWKENYSQFLRIRKERANMNIDSACDVVTPIFKNSTDETEVQEGIRQLDQAKQYLANADKARNDRWAEARDKGQKQLDEIRKKGQKEKDKAALLASIPPSAGNLSIYARNLQLFIEKYPQDPATPGLAALLQDIPASQAACALQNASFEGKPEEARDRINRYLTEFGQLNASVWNPDATAWVAVVNAQAKLKSGVTALLADPPVGLFNLKYIKYRRQGDINEPFQRLYMPEDETMQRATDPEDAKHSFAYTIRRVCKVAGKKSPPENVHYGMELDTSAGLFPNYGLSTRTMVFDTNNDQGYLSEQDAFLRTLVAEADASSNVEGLVMKKLQLLAADTEIPPIPRAWIAQQLASLLANATGDYKELAKATAAWKLEAPWVDPRNPATEKINQMLERDYEGIPMVKLADRDYQRRMANFKLLSTALSRRLMVGGTLQKDAAGRFNIVSVTGQPYKEGWILKTSGQNALPVFKIAITLQNGTPRILDEFQKNEALVPGQLFFIPADGRDTPALLKERRDAGATIVPDSWPKNGLAPMLP